MEMASYFSRFFSGIINLLIWILVTLGLFFLLSYIFVYVLLSQGLTLQEIQANATSLVFQDRVTQIFLYFMLFGFWDIVLAAMTASRMQGTLGKYFLNLKVTDLDGMRLSFVKSFLRETLKSFWILAPLLSFVFLNGGQSGDHNWKFVLFLCFLISSSCYFLVFVTKKRQGFHDLMAGTLVKKKD